MNLVSQQPTRLRRCLLKHSKHWTKFVIIETLLFGISNALLFGIFSFFVVVANIHTRVQERSCAIATRKGDGSSFWHSTFQVEWAGSGVSDLKTLSLSCCVSRVHEWETTDSKKKNARRGVATVAAAWPWSSLPPRALEALAACFLVLMWYLYSYSEHFSSSNVEFGFRKVPRERILWLIFNEANQSWL